MHLVVAYVTVYPLDRLLTLLIDRIDHMNLQFLRPITSYTSARNRFSAGHVKSTVRFDIHVKHCETTHVSSNV